MSGFTSSIGDVGDIGASSRPGEQQELSTEPMDSEQTLSQLYEAALNAFTNLGAKGPVTEDAFNKALDILTKTAAKVRAASLFSRNETLEDIPTANIKFLYLPYFHAKVCCQCPALEKRRAFIVEGNTYMQAFLSKCIALGGLLQPEEMEQLAGPEEEGEDGRRRAAVSDAERRQRKIAKYKRDKETQVRMEFLRRFISSSSAEEEEDELEEGDEVFRLGGVDREPEVRELSILQLQSYARSCIDDIEMNNQELAMLTMRDEAEMRRREQMEHEFRARSDARTRDSSSSSTSSISGSTSSMAIGQAPRFTPEEYAARPGLSVTRFGKVGDEVVMRRDTVKADVFRPRMEGPTMSIEEFADMEVAQAREREAREKEGNPDVIKKYKQLEADGEEENIDLVDKATMKERDWDTWKEDNPRGWGNKAGKIF